MRTYKIVGVCSMGKYTINNIVAENILSAIGKGLAEFRREYPIYPWDIFSIERVDKHMPDALINDEEWAKWFDGCI